MFAVKSIFDTLQGEGRRAGTRAVFVRFAGCNLWSGRPVDRERGAGACARWCDSDFFKGARMTSDQIVGRMNELWPGSGERWCVLTGGEPLLQVSPVLIGLLHSHGWKVAVETNGTIAPPDGIDWITVSPKLGASAATLDRVDELKVVLPGDVVGPGWTDEMLCALATSFRPGFRYVQPQDSIDPNMVEVSHLVGGAGSVDTYTAAVRRCVEFVRAHPDWALSVQAHKIIGLP